MHKLDRKFLTTSKPKKPIAAVLTLAILLGAVSPSFSADSPEERELDLRVRAFLDSQSGKWRDLNVPEADGRIMHRLIVANGYRRALELGTSTGHSAIWIAWALSKTGGKLITIEIDPDRHRRALENFKQAGLSEFIDARLGDAHELVPELEGTFDFVFVDADKEWYPNYFKMLYPKLERCGTYAAHNVTTRHQRANPEIRNFLRLARKTSGLDTEIIRATNSGLSVSIKFHDGELPDLDRR